MRVIGMSATLCPTSASVGTGSTGGGAGGAGGFAGGCCAPAAQLNESSAMMSAGIGFTAGK
jgi:hypothetical protein